MYERHISTCRRPGNNGQRSGDEAQSDSPDCHSYHAGLPGGRKVSRLSQWTPIDQYDETRKDPMAGTHVFIASRS